VSNFKPFRPLPGQWTGVLVTTLDALAKAGVNIIMSEAMGVGGNYGFFIPVAPADVERTAQALKVK
jgi:hypothetical protein